MDEIRNLRQLANMKELGENFLFKPNNHSDDNTTLLYVRRENEVVGSLRCTFYYHHPAVSN